MPHWVPFYRVTVGLALRAFPDLFLTPRAVTVFFGLIAIPAGAWLAHELFQSRKVTLITLILNSFFSQRIALSLAPLSSIMFTSLMLITLAAFARWLRSGERRAFWICAFMAALASTVRYEGWLVNACMFLVCAGIYLSGRGKLKLSELALFGFVLFAFPAFWTIHLFPADNPVKDVVADSRQFTPRQVIEKNPLLEFLVTNGLTLNLIGLVTMFQIVRRGRPNQKLFIVAAFTGLICVALIMLCIYSAQTGPSWRDISLWSMLLIPFTACLLAGEAWAFGRAQKVVTLGALVVVLCAFLDDTARIERDSTWAFPPYDRRAGQYLDRLISHAPATKVLIESSLFFFVNVEVASQHPDSFVFNSIPEQQSRPVLPIGASVRRVADAQGVKLLIFQTPQYTDFLDHSPDVIPLRKFGPWSLYKVAN